MTWTLMIFVGLSGLTSNSLNITTLPMRNQEACIAAAKGLGNNSSHIGFACVSSETGEVIRADDPRLKP